MVKVSIRNEELVVRHIGHCFFILILLHNDRGCIFEDGLNCIVHILCGNSTLKSNCPVFKRLSATQSKDRAVLRLKKLELKHNHELSEELNEMLPHKWRLTQQQQSDVQTLVCHSKVVI